MNIPKKFKFTSNLSHGVHEAVASGSFVDVVWNEYVHAKSRHSVGYVESCFNNGRWKIIPEEPKLVFPFTYTLRDGAEGGTVTKIGNRVKVKYSNGWTDYGTWSIEDAKYFIKEGIWIVTSVGEQKPVEAPTPSVGTLKLQVDSLQVKDATEALKELNEAVKDVNHSLARMQAILGEIGCKGSVEYTNSVDFNFEDF